MSRQRKYAIAFLALALTALPVIASAQVPQHIVRPRPTHELASATRVLAEQAARESRGRFARAAQRLAQEATQVGGYGGDTSRFEEMYVRTRRMLFARDFEGAPSDALLDAWERVAVSYAPIRRAAPMPMPQPHPVPPQPAVYEFEGRFEQTPVRLTGRTLDELDASCIQFTSAIDTRYVDDVMIGSQSVRNGPSYWDASALCSIAVLNASTRLSYAPVRATGSIEGVPFAVHGTRDAIDRVLRTHVPRLVRTLRVDDVTINGQTYRNGPSFWNAEQIVAIIASQLPGGTPTTQHLSARGRIERTAFFFNAHDARELESQCLSFVPAAVTDWIDELEIEGRTLRNPSGYWDAAQVCRIISTQARQG
jgi:hypothetical protein